MKRNADIGLITKPSSLFWEVFDFGKILEVGILGPDDGLVESGLMLLGIVGHARAIPEAGIVDACRRFAAGFEQHFSSLLCRDLRPRGFHPDNPPHLCEDLTGRAIDYTPAFAEALLVSDLPLP